MIEAFLAQPWRCTQLYLVLVLCIALPSSQRWQQPTQQPSPLLSVLSLVMCVVVAIGPCLCFFSWLLSVVRHQGRRRRRLRPVVPTMSRSMQLGMLDNLRIELAGEPAVGEPPRWKLFKVVCFG